VKERYIKKKTRCDTEIYIIIINNNNNNIIPREETLSSIETRSCLRAWEEKEEREEERSRNATGRTVRVGPR
jgi:hypothetical protein|tara:strand:- start:3619 stop:3834 length:216 start_codon:yes stop_codon:yes gene_type:complete